MLGDIAYFVAFIGIYVSYLMISNQVLKLVQGGRENQLAVSALSAIVAPIAILGMLWPLTRTFDFAALLILLAVYLGAVAASALVRLLHGDPELFSAQLRWLSQASLVNHPVLFGLMIVVLGLAYLFFPIVIGVLYVVMEVPSTSFSTWSVRLVLVWMIGIGMVFTGTLRIPGLTSDSLDLRSRDVTMISGIISLVPDAVLISILARISGDDATERLSVAVIASYAAGAIVLPYLVGRQRSVAQSAGLLGKRRRFLVDLKRTLVEPLSDIDRIERLGHLRTQLFADNDEVANEPDTKLAIALINEDKATAMMLLSPGDEHHHGGTQAFQQRFSLVEERYDSLRQTVETITPTNIRAQHVDAVDRNLKNLKRIALALGQAPSPEPIEATAGDWWDADDARPPPAWYEATEPEGRPWYALTETADPMPAPANPPAEADAADVLQRFERIVDFDLSEVDKQLDRVRDTAPKTFVSLVIGSLSSIALGLLGDSVASVVVDVARDSVGI